MADSSDFRILFDRKGDEGAVASVYLRLRNETLTVSWSGDGSGPVYTGHHRLTSNAAFSATLLDYLIHTLAEKRAWDDGELPGWEPMVDVDEFVEDAESAVDELTAIQIEADAESSTGFESEKKTQEARKKLLKELQTTAGNAKKQLERFSSLMAQPLLEKSKQAQAWCSACFNFCVHEKLAAQRAWMCSGCGNPTAPCSTLRCEHFAFRGTRAWDVTKPHTFLCAEHLHEVPNFELQDERISDPSDWKKLFSFRKKNIARSTKRGIAILSAASLAFPLFGFASKGIGGAVGVATTKFGTRQLSGAAAYRYGLALLGGGAKASGGLGMAGGKLVVSLVGAGIGGAAGNRMVSSYISSDSSFEVDKLRDGSGPAVIFSSGFLTEKNADWKDWEKLINTAYPNSPVYCVRWGSKELRTLALMGGEAYAKAAASAAVKTLAKQAAKVASKALTPISHIATVTTLVNNPWNTALARSSQAGTALARILAKTDHKDGFVLVGHSLGAALMATTSTVLGQEETTSPVIATYLLGAAYPSVVDTAALTRGSNGTIFNYHSRRDSVLQSLYRAARLGGRAAGEKGFSSPTRGLINVDVSENVPSHSAYLTKVRLHREQRLWL